MQTILVVTTVGLLSFDLTTFSLQTKISSTFVQTTFILTNFALTLVNYVNFFLMAFHYKRSILTTFKCINLTKNNIFKTIINKTMTHSTGGAVAQMDASRQQL
jgi:hypothetical protein